MLEGMNDPYIYWQMDSAELRCAAEPKVEWYEWPEVSNLTYSIT